MPLNHSLINNPHELGILVINWRKKLKLSQAAVGNLVGLKQTTISAFENNPAGTKLDTLFRILSALNLELSIAIKHKKNTTKTEW